MATTITSTSFSLNWQDALKGFLVAAITAPITIITDTLNTGILSFDWKKIGLIALTAGVSYLVKNFLTPAQVVTPAKEVADENPTGN